MDVTRILTERRVVDRRLVARDDQCTISRTTVIDMHKVVKTRQGCARGVHIRESTWLVAKRESKSGQRWRWRREGKGRLVEDDMA